MSHELTANGKLRVGVAFAPAPTPLFIVKDADGTPRGVTVDLGHALAKKLGVAVEFFIAPNTGLLTDELEAGNIDVSFMPVDEERKKRIAFGPVYFLVESTYLATGASGIKKVEEVDRAGVRVVGIANTTTIRAAGRSLGTYFRDAIAGPDPPDREAGHTSPDLPVQFVESRDLIFKNQCRSLGSACGDTPQGCAQRGCVGLRQNGMVGNHLQLA